MMTVFGLAAFMLALVRAMFFDGDAPELILASGFLVSCFAADAGLALVGSVAQRATKAGADSIEKAARSIQSKLRE